MLEVRVLPSEAAVPGSSSRYLRFMEVERAPTGVGCFVHNPGHADHRFRWMPSSRSESCRPPVPTACRPLFRAYRNRWTTSPEHVDDLTGIRTLNHQSLLSSLPTAEARLCRPILRPHRERACEPNATETRMSIVQA